MRHFIFVVFSLLLLSMDVQSQTMDLFDKLVYSSSEDSLPYRLLKPVNPGALEKFPLFIFLHGAGERGNDNEAQIKHIKDLVLDPKYRGKYPCYVLAPQCPKGKWWADHSKDGVMLTEPSKPMTLLIALIENLSKEFPIDEDRIYISGVSMGGFGTWYLMARFPDKFAAAIPVCGGGDAKSASKIKDIPTWAFHGALDQVVPPKRSRQMISALQKEGGKPGYTEYPDVAHNSWVQAYQEPHLLPWLFKQKKIGNSAK
jgi:predicted peptidase